MAEGRQETQRERGDSVRVSACAGHVAVACCGDRNARVEVDAGRRPPFDMFTNLRTTVARVGSTTKAPSVVASHNEGLASGV